MVTRKCVVEYIVKYIDGVPFYTIKRSYLEPIG